MAKKESFSATYPNLPGKKVTFGRGIIENSPRKELVYTLTVYDKKTKETDSAYLKRNSENIWKLQPTSGLKEYVKEIEKQLAKTILLNGD